MATADVILSETAPADPDAAQPPARSLIGQAYVDTVARLGARVGLTWLTLLAFLAIFAPFLATTHPLLMKLDGRWSSPVLKHVKPADVVLLVATLGVLILSRWRAASLSLKLIVLASLILVTSIVALATVHPPENVIYSNYRDWQAAGRATRVLHAPIPFSPDDHLDDVVDARLKPPGRVHWLGTDNYAADVASQLIHASRVALSIGFLSTSIAVVIGVVVGALMGYYAGVLDLLGMRVIEIIESVPRLFLLIAITAFYEKRNIYLMMTVLGLTSWTGYARFLRAEFFTIRKLDYVQAAIAAGLPRRLILFRHMLANALTPILVSTTFGVASAILYESILTFLGLGLVNESSWGGLLEQARSGGSGFVWWIATFPGLAIFLTVYSYNLVGDAIRDALDPKLRKRD